MLRGDDSMEEVIRGRAFVFGDNINTDLIHPAKYFSLDYKKIKEGLFKGIDSSLAKRISEKNSVIVAGKILVVVQVEKYLRKHLYLIILKLLLLSLLLEYFLETVLIRV